MSEDTKRILELLASGKVTVEEAEKLLRAIGTEPPAGSEAAGATEKPSARYVRIAVQESASDRGPGKNVNIRVPIALVKGGMRLGSMIPGYGDRISEHLRRHGIELDMSKLNSANFEAALKDMGDMSVDVEHGKAQVRITCE
jgi:hypothetical protein